MFLTTTFVVRTVPDQSRQLESLRHDDIAALRITQAVRKFHTLPVYNETGKRNLTLYEVQHG